eukprot:jgi/Chlat1/8090/Chrsp75S07548
MADPDVEWLEGDYKQEVNGEASVSGRGAVSDQEIARLTVDELLSDLDRAKLFLNPSSHELQVKCALASLPRLYREHGRAAHDALLGGSSGGVTGQGGHGGKSRLAQLDHDGQVLVGEAFCTVLKDTSLNFKEVAVWVLPVVLSGLSASRDEEVVRSWLGVLSLLVPLLPLKVVREEVAEMAVRLGEVDETVQSRAACCALLGALAPRIAADDATIFNKAMTLCQDTDYQVRVAMCHQLDAFAHAVGPERTQNVVLKELEDLLNDEEVAVRTAALQALVALADVLPIEARKTRIVPIVKAYCPASTSAEEHMSLELCRLFGELLRKIGAELSEADWEVLLEAYKAWATHHESTMRQSAAHNLPGVLKAMGVRKYAMQLHSIYTRLAADPDATTRASIAGSLHEVARMLGKERTATYLKDMTIALLQDQSFEVLGVLLPNLAFILGQFGITNEQQRAAAYQELLPALTAVESRLTSQWRLQKTYMETLIVLPSCFSSDDIYENFVPICFRYIYGGAAPVRNAAAEAIVVLLRCNKRASQQMELAGRLVRELGRGRSYWSRLLFLACCQFAIKHASSKFFKDTFLEPALEATQDTVANVRLAACAMLVGMKGAIKLPEDVALLARINQCATQLASDSDRDVSAAARAVQDEFKRLPIRTSGPLPPAGSQSTAHAIEVEDRRRFEQEQAMLTKEEHEEKRRLERAQQQQEAQRKLGAVGDNDPLKLRLRMPVGAELNKRPALLSRSISNGPVVLSALAASNNGDSTKSRSNPSSPVIPTAPARVAPSVSLKLPAATALSKTNAIGQKESVSAPISARSPANTQRESITASATAPSAKTAMSNGSSKPTLSADTAGSASKAASTTKPVVRIASTNGRSTNGAPSPKPATASSNAVSTPAASNTSKVVPASASVKPAAAQSALHARRSLDEVRRKLHS